MRIFSLIAMPLLSTFLCAQTQPGHALVVTQEAGPSIELLDVDLETGSIDFFGSFPSKFNMPLAVEIDPVNQDIILAIANGPNSRVLRLTPSGRQIIGERLLGDVPGWVTNLIVSLHVDAIFASVTGHQQAIYRLPRNGDTADRLIDMPRATALSDTGWVAQSSDPAPGGDAPQFQLIRLDTGEVVVMPEVLANFSAPGLTGIIEIPSALGFVIIADSNGNLTRAAGFATPVPLDATPQLPPGSTTAIELQDGQRPIVLGNDAHPFLKTVDIFSTTSPTWEILSGPLPGSPRDFDLAAPARAELLQFGDGCTGPGAPPRVTPSMFGRTPTLGNQNFTLNLHSAEVGLPTVMALGSSDQQHLGSPLPIVLPAGGCLLRTSIFRVFAGMSNAMGTVEVSLPIPDDPGFIGETFFAQWVILNGAELQTTNAVAIRISEN